MKYKDFRLWILPEEYGAYPLRVMESPLGELPGDTNVVMEWPFTARQLDRELEAFTTALDRRNPPAIRRAALRQVEQFGGKLFEAVMPGAVRTHYNESLKKAADLGFGLRLRLYIEPPELAALPWEFMYDTGRGGYTGLSASTPVTRYLQVDKAVRSMLTLEPPLGILAMAATPSGWAPLNVADEREHIEKAVDHLVKSGQVRVRWIEGQTEGALRAALGEDGPWHIFHFVGHGGFDRGTQEGYLVLADEEGRPSRVSAPVLAEILAGHEELRLVVLNSCEGGRADPEDIFSSTGSIVTKVGLPAVVSMQYQVSDDAAVEFSREFYDCLAGRFPVEEALTSARNAVSNRWAREEPDSDGTTATRSDTMEWGTPVLHMRSRHGRLFRIDPGAAVFPGIGPITWTLPEVDPDLVTLRDKVRDHWVDGVLASMRERSTFVEDLEMEVLRAGGGGFGDEDEDDGVELLGRGGAISDLFDREGRSLLILGEPGGGKTRTLLTLCARLLGRAERHPAHPVPVVVQLIGWTDGPMIDWLTREVSAKYSMPRDLVRRWFENRRLTPLLDGLDEVRPEARADCVAEINRFVDSVAGAVVSSRYKEYTALPDDRRLAVRCAVRLRRMRRDQVIETVSPKLRGVLERDSALRIEARSPFMLSLIERAYADMSPEELVVAGADTAEARRRHILETYVSGQFQKQRESSSDG